MRKFSLAQAPKSAFLQRSLQNGRNGLINAKTLSPPQVGQVTNRGFRCGVFSGECMKLYCLEPTGGSGAQGQFKARILVAGMQAFIRFKAHQPDGHHQPVATDFWNQAQRLIEGQTK